MYKEFGQFINGKWQESSNKETYEVINPANEEVIGNASKASPEDVSKALQSAENGLNIWKNTPAWERSYIIRRIADRIREKKRCLSEMDGFRGWKTINRRFSRGKWFSGYI